MPVPANQLADAKNWLIDAYTYKATPFYGGPKRDPYKVTPTGVIVAKDGKSVELLINDRKPNFVYHIRIDAKTAGGETMWSPEAWVTFHKAPKL